VFEGLVAATLDHPDDRAIKAAAIAIMSTRYGFALLRMNDRLKPFMYGTLTQSDLINAVLSIKLAAKKPRRWPKGQSEGPRSKRAMTRRSIK
jgi:hypothetical protein